MPEFRRVERLACWVDFFREVEAPTLDQAIEMFEAEQGTFTGHAVGDNLDGYEPDFEYLELPPPMKRESPDV